MPLPSPFYLRNSQNTPLTHSQLDGNLSILSTKIDNTIGNNLGQGVGLYHSKSTSANEGKFNFYTLSGTNGVSISVAGDSIIVEREDKFTGVSVDTNPNVEGYSQVLYSTIGGTGTIFLGDPNNLPLGFEVTLIRKDNTNAVNVTGDGVNPHINGNISKLLPSAAYSTVTCTAIGAQWACSTSTIL